MSNTHRHLERHALQAHRHGERWNQFWAEHGAAVREAEPFDNHQFRRLVGRLLHLLVCGNLDGLFPTGDDPPWLVDDEASPRDSMTQARCQLPLVPMPSRVEPTP